VTYEQQIASAGAIAAGLRYRPRWVRYAVRGAVLGLVAIRVIALVVPLASALGA
jgi:hypothetical protein